MLKHIFKYKMKSIKEEKWKSNIVWPVSQDSREASSRQTHHQQMVVK